MINNLLKKNYHILIGGLLIISVYMGFFLNENVTQGPKFDFYHALKQVEEFKKNFIFSFLNFDELDDSTRISPIFISIIYLFDKLLNNVDLTRFVLLNIILLNQIFFYKCLKLTQISIILSKNKLFILSCVILISPSFRANAIWPESAMLGLLFFIISIYYYLKFQKKKQTKYAIYNIIFLALSSYIRPSFCLFSLFFFLEFFRHYFNSSKIKIIYLIILNLILAFPAYYYVFILDVFFIDYGGLSSNYFNKILIISSIVIFHMLPLFLYTRSLFIIGPKKILILVTSIIIFFILSIQNFDYNLIYSGGGIVLHLSNFLLGNNYIFYLFAFFSIFMLLRLSDINFNKNLIIILILLLMTPQYHIFHKYYDPLVIILFFTLIDVDINFEKIKKFNFLLIIYIFYILLYFTHLINNTLST